MNLIDFSTKRTALERLLELHNGSPQRLRHVLHGLRPVLMHLPQGPKPRQRRTGLGARRGLIIACKWKLYIINYYNIYIR